MESADSLAKARGKANERRMRPVKLLSALGAFLVL